MKTNLHVLLAIVLIVQAHVANSQQWLWAKESGGPVQSTTSAFGITTDKEGNSYVTGYYHDSVTFAPGVAFSNIGVLNSDAYVAKYDGNGNLSWITVFTNSEFCVGRNVSVDESGNVYVTGYFTGETNFSGIIISPKYFGTNAFVVKLDDKGNPLWATYAGDAEPLNGLHHSVYSYGIGTDILGNAYITGWFNKSARFTDNDILTGPGDAGYQMFIAKYNSNGTFVWARQAGGDLHEEGLAIAVDKEGFSFVTGRFGSKTADFDGITLSCHNASANVFIACYDPVGNIQWANQAVDVNDQVYTISAGNSITIDESGSSYITGEFSGDLRFDAAFLSTAVAQDYDLFVAKYDSKGKVVWARQDGGTQYEIGKAVSYDPGSNEVYVAGVYLGNSVFDGNQVLPNFGSFDIFIAQFDASAGGFQEITNIGNNGSCYAHSIAAGPENSYYLSGEFASFATTFYDMPNGFNVITLNGFAGSSNGFAAKYQNKKKNIASDGPAEAVMIYPNPVDSWLTIRGTYHDATLEIVNESGLVIGKTILNGTDPNIDLSPFSLRSGNAYYLLIQNQVVRVIKK